MAIWIEIRCDALGEDCYSHENIGPMKLSPNDRNSLLEVFRDLKHRAKRQGWKRGSGTWYCPTCSGKLKT